MKKKEVVFVVIRSQGRLSNDEIKEIVGPDKEDEVFKILAMKKDQIRKTLDIIRINDYIANSVRGGISNNEWVNIETFTRLVLVNNNIEVKKFSMQKYQFYNKKWKLLQSCNEGMLSMSCNVKEKEIVDINLLQIFEGLFFSTDHDHQ